ncbi:MAG: hypothetical protein ACO1QB_06000, partial [Verrucomicrobiales bacterium]
MRLSTYLQISFLTGAVMTPAMAQDAQNAQEEALRILRQATVQPASANAGRPVAPQNHYTEAATNATQPLANSSSLSTTSVFASPSHEEALRVLRSAYESPSRSAKNLQNPGLTVRPSLETSREFESEVSRSRSDREQRLQEQARQADSARKLKQTEKRRQWEVDIAERERLRQRQREYDESVARELGGRNSTLSTASISAVGNPTAAANRASASMAGNQNGTFAGDYGQELRAKAQRMTDETNGGISAATAANIDSTAPLDTASEAAASITSDLSSSAPGKVSAGSSDEAAIEARALEILRQNKTASSPSIETPASAAAPADSTAAPAASNDELIRRAQEVLRSQQPTSSQSNFSPAPAPASSDDQSRPSEVLRQQAGR